MPLYEYECKQCHQRMEKIQSFSAPLETVCPKCGGALERVISAPAIQFKGAGWYVNDYAKSGKAATAKGEAEANGKAASPGDGVAAISASSSESKADVAGAKPAGDAAPAAAASPSGSSPSAPPTTTGSSSS